MQDGELARMMEEDAVGPKAESDEIDVSSEGLQKLAVLATQQIKIEDEIARLTAELETQNKALTKVSEVDIPNLMDELQVQAFTLKTGAKIDIKKITRASISKANQEAAFTWLKNHKAGSLIKNQVVLSFGMKQDALANKFLRDLARRKTPIQFEQKKSVHANSLTAFVKERLESGQEVPMEPNILGVFQGKQAKITRPVTK